MDIVRGVISAVVVPAILALPANGVPPACSEAISQFSHPPGQEIGIFFLGNSYTAASGGQQRIVPKLLEAGRGVTVRVGHLGRAGETLQGHLERNRGEWPRWREKRAVERHIPRYKREGKTEEEIEAILEMERAACLEEKGALDQAILDGSPWDYVVLQVGKGRFDPKRYELASAVGELTAMFRELSPESVLILYSTWVDQETPDLQSNTDAFCRELASKYGLGMAPAGFAMHAAHAGRSELKIFRTDTDSHPGIHGAYLVACTLYSAITGESPIGLPNSFLIETSYDFGSPDEERSKLFQVSMDDARYLQQTAWKAHLGNESLED